MARKMSNTPEVKLGILGVSRDCFPVSLTRGRLEALVREVKSQGLAPVKCSVVIENEKDALQALAELAQKNCNAAVVFLGNFGPEGPSSLFAQRFPGPVMVCAAAEENRQVLLKDRGDALCGLLSLSYNLGLRGVRAYIPERPVGLPAELAVEIKDFEAIARVVLGAQNLKIFSFGPRPQDFFTCHAPLQPLFDLGVEVMENSELDLLQLFRKAGDQKDRVNAVAREMKKELGKGASYPELLPRLAQFEVALLDFMEQNLGAAKFAVFANKCWPAFESEFGFVPCYVNSRLAGKGIPVACEVDLYGALSEYLVQLAALSPATILDVNNTVPEDLIPKAADLKGASRRDLFMAFHCGNTSSMCMKDFRMSYQLIMNRLMEQGREPEITRGTLEGQLASGPVTLFRIHSRPDCRLAAYLAEGYVLDLAPGTFGGTGVVAIPGFARFYRHILVGKQFPHHAALGFQKTGRIIFEALKLLGINEVATPLPERMLYQTENPFARSD